MNEQAQRIAIATFCGWQAIELRDSIKSGKKDWLSGLNPKPDEIVKVIDAESGEERAPNESDYGYETLPDYFNDLNAMHEAEKFLVEFRNDNIWKNRCHSYDDALWKICAPINNPGKIKTFCFPQYATASQRAKAFIAAIEEWRP